MYTIQGKQFRNVQGSIATNIQPRSHASVRCWLTIMAISVMLVARFAAMANAGMMLQGTKLQGTKLQGTKLQGTVEMPGRPIRTGPRNCQVRVLVGLRAMGYAMVVSLWQAWHAAAQLAAPAPE